MSGVTILAELSKVTTFDYIASFVLLCIACFLQYVFRSGIIKPKIRKGVFVIGFM